MGNQGLMCESRGAQLGVPHSRSSISYYLYPSSRFPFPSSRKLFHLRTWGGVGEASDGHVQSVRGRGRRELNVGLLSRVARSGRRRRWPRRRQLRDGLEWKKLGDEAARVRRPWRPWNGRHALVDRSVPIGSARRVADLCGWTREDERVAEGGREREREREREIEIERERETEREREREREREK